MKNLEMKEIKVIDCVTKKGVKFIDVMTPFQTELSEYLGSLEWDEVHVHNVKNSGKTTVVLASLVDAIYNGVFEDVAFISQSKCLSHQSMAELGYANNLVHTPQGLHFNNVCGEERCIKVTDVQGLKRLHLDVLVVYNHQKIDGLAEMIQNRGDKIKKIIYINDGKRVHVGVKEK